jgi:starch phosphorylase
LTTKDGWTDEVDWLNIGWVIDEGNAADSLYNLIEQQIAPLYYQKNGSSFNESWVEMMLNSMLLALSRYSSTRMLKEYITSIYKKIINENQN